MEQIPSLEISFSEFLSSGDSGHPSSPSAHTLSLADVTLSAQGWSAPPSSKRALPAALLRSVLAALSSLRWQGARQEPQNAVERAAELAVLLLQQNQHAALKVRPRFGENCTAAESAFNEWH